MKPHELEPGPLAQVECHTDGERWTLVFVRDIRHAPAKVWAALTNPEQLRQWAPFDPERDLSSLGPTVLKMTDGDATEEYPAIVSRAEPPRLLEYTWGDDLLRWELAPHGVGTRLTLRHSMESRDWVPRTAAGWHLCLVVVERMLDGRPVGRIVGSEAKKYGWERVHDAYAAALGIAGKGWPEEVHPDA